MFISYFFNFFLLVSYSHNSKLKLIAPEFFILLLITLLSSFILIDTDDFLMFFYQ